MSKIRKGDKVKVLTGKDKGQVGIVQKVLTSVDKVLVENINMVTKHVKPTRNAEGRVEKVNRPIHISNVILVDSKTDKPTRVGFKVVDGKKYRIARKTSELIDK